MDQLVIMKATMESTDATTKGKSDCERMQLLLAGLPPDRQGEVTLDKMKAALKTADGQPTALQPPEDLLISLLGAEPKWLGQSIQAYAVVRPQAEEGTERGSATLLERKDAKPRNVTRGFAVEKVPKHKISHAQLHYAVEVWEALMAVAAPVVAGKLRALWSATLCANRAGVSGACSKDGQSSLVKHCIETLNRHLEAWAHNLTMVVSAVRTADVLAPGQLQAGVFDATSTFHKTVAAPAAPPTAPPPKGGF